jgi:alkanesulfonate monooxygenase SsuD/methylene tetrahydromethanopterin reductase-like flavin-dependent oxidoreductase (luciferase family)
MTGIRVAYVPSRMFGAGAPEVRRVVQLAEDRGLDGLGVGDHISFFIGVGADGLLGAAAILAASERLTAVVGVYLLPLRHPVLVARQLADLSALAPGRLVLGVGIGGEDPHEVEICGVDPRTRGRRMDECLQVVRGLQTGEPLDHDGEFFQLHRAVIVPAPAVPVPLIVGGRSDAAIRRAGRLGDGWYSIWSSPARYAGAIDQMRAAAEEAGRGPVEWHNALNVWCGVGSSAAEGRSFVAPAMTAFYQTPYERFEKWSPAGTPAQIAEFLTPYIEAGCHTFNVIAQGASLEAEIDAVAEIRERLLSP